MNLKVTCQLAFSSLRASLSCASPAPLQSEGVDKTPLQDNSAGYTWQDHLPASIQWDDHWIEWAEICHALPHFGCNKRYGGTGPVPCWQQDIVVGTFERVCGIAYSSRYSWRPRQ